ncbi:10365_t:CDS:2, partial [Racocetra fulgida]
VIIIGTFMDALNALIMVTFKQTNSDTDEETNSDGETILELNEQQLLQNDIIVQIQIVAAGDANV